MNILRRLPRRLRSLESQEWVDPARVVAANLWIDYLTVIPAKLSVCWVVLVVWERLPQEVAFRRVYSIMRVLWEPNCVA